MNAAAAGVPEMRNLPRSAGVDCPSPVATNFVNSDHCDEGSNVKITHDLGDMPPFQKEEATDTSATATLDRICPFEQDALANDNHMFDPGEMWRFLVNDFVVPPHPGQPPNFGSIGIGAASQGPSQKGDDSKFAPDGSNSSILAATCVWIKKEGPTECVEAVPEPSTLWLLVCGALATLVSAALRRRPAWKTP